MRGTAEEAAVPRITVHLDDARPAGGEPCAADPVDQRYAYIVDNPGPCQTRLTTPAHGTPTGGLQDVSRRPAALRRHSGGTPAAPTHRAHGRQSWNAGRTNGPAKRTGCVARPSGGSLGIPTDREGPGTCPESARKRPGEPAVVATSVGWRAHRSRVRGRAMECPGAGPPYATWAARTVPGSPRTRRWLLRPRPMERRPPRRGHAAPP